MESIKEIAERFGQPMGKQFILVRDGIRLRAKFVKKGLVICSKDGVFLSDQWLQFLLQGQAVVEKLDDV